MAAIPDTLRGLSFGISASCMDYKKEVLDFMAHLRLESPKDLSLDQLRNLVVDKSDEHSIISTEDVLHIYCAWLKDKLEVVDNSNEDTFEREIASWCHALESHALDAEYILTRFEIWQREQVEIEPQCARRLNLAGLELRRQLAPRFVDTAIEPQEIRLENLPQLTSGISLDGVCTPQPPAQNIAFQGIHPDRMRVVAGQPRESIVIDLDNWEAPVIELRSDSNQSPERHKEENLSFLTGANRMVFDGDENELAGESNKKSKTKETHLAERRFQGSSSQKSSNLEQLVSQSEAAKISLPSKRGSKKTSTKPPDGYKCKKCGVPGHWVFDCGKPTGKPPGDYRCNRCGITGHWVNDCVKPMGSDPVATRPPPRGFVCTICKQGGHWFSDCPSVRSDGMEPPYQRETRQRDKMRQEEDRYRPQYTSMPHPRSRDYRDRSPVEDRVQRAPDSRSRSRSPLPSWVRSPSRSSHRSGRRGAPEYCTSPRHDQGQSSLIYPYSSVRHSSVAIQSQEVSDEMDLDEHEDEHVAPFHNKNAGKILHFERSRRVLSPGREIPRQIDPGRLSYWDEFPTGRNNQPSSTNRGNKSEKDGQDMSMGSSVRSEDWSSSCLEAADALLSRLIYEVESHRENNQRIFAMLDETSAANLQTFPLNDDPDVIASEDDEADPQKTQPQVLLGVTVKNIMGDPAYHDKLQELFERKKNVWVRRSSSRPTSLQMWTKMDLNRKLATATSNDITLDPETKMTPSIFRDTTMLGEDANGEDGTSQELPGIEATMEGDSSLKGCGEHEGSSKGAASASASSREDIGIATD